MPVYKSVSVADAAYIAGLFDGEGCISTYTSLSLRVNIAQKVPGVLYWVHATLGYGCVRLRKDKTSYFECNTNDTMKQFLSTVLPYLRVKCDQARLGIELLSLCQPRDKKLIYRMDSETWERRLSLCLQLRQMKGTASRLNKRRLPLKVSRQVTKVKR